MEVELNTKRKKAPTKKAARKNLSSNKVCSLWVASGGRCEYDGCNKQLWKDSLTARQMNTAYIAHIISAKPDGPRGNKLLSPKLETELSNLMLLCDECHRRIDKEQIAEHTVERLTRMKKSHESRIVLATSISPEKKSRILLFGARIGANNPILNYSEAAGAIFPDWYPASDHAVELGLGNALHEDHTKEYWDFQASQLEMAFNKDVRHYLGEHLSVFGLAPMPLLIKLGSLLGDIQSVEVYQRHREPATWKWLHGSEEDQFASIQEPGHFDGVPVLNLSLSANITDDRIYAVTGHDTSIWRIQVPHPHNDYLKSRKQLSQIREVFRIAFERIRTQHGNKEIHVFSAMPVAAAVELGRIRMPKADPKLVLYDQNHKQQGFFRTLTIE